MFDQDKYRQEVLDPARRNGNVAPADLFTRYAMSIDQIPRGDRFPAHLAEVLKYWQSLTQRRAYLRLAETLISAHRQLDQAGRLTAEHFAAERDRHTAETSQKIKEVVDDMVSGGQVVAATTVARVAAGLGVGAEADLRRELTKLRVRILDELWPLPETAPGKGRDVLRDKRLLGLRLAVDVLATDPGSPARPVTLRKGLRLNGQAVTAQMFREARDRAERRAQDDRKTATENLLVNLGDAVQRGSLDQLVLWELTEVMREAAEMPMATVRRVSREAVRVGLDSNEAEELALALLMAREGTAAPRNPTAEVEELFAAGSLRAAERLIATLPAEEGVELRQRIQEAVRKVAGLVTRAQQEIAAGRPEHAAELLTEAVREAADDTDLAGRLRMLAPPAVPSARVGAASGDHVTASWTPSPARTGGVAYQVVRTRQRPAGSATDGEVVGRTDGNEIVDSRPPAGDDLYYTVFATRSDGVWSPGTSAGPVTLLPEVTDVSVTADETSVRVGWQARSDATRVTVARADGSLVACSRGGFTEEGLQPGREYRYLIRAGYDAGNGRVIESTGVTATAMPQQAPRAVPDLVVEPLPGQDPGRLRLAWTAPAAGTVRLRSAPHRPRWQRGAELTETELDGYGSELVARAEPASDGRFALTVPMAQGRIFVTAFSVGAGRAVCGPTVSVTNTAPVARLRARRIGTQVRLSWEWPPGIGLVRVRWWSEGAEGHVEETDCWLRSYRDDGGLEIPAGSGAVHVSVATVSRDTEGEAVGSPVSVRVAGTGMRVRYRFVESNRLFRRRTRIEVSAEQVCPLPELIVVQTAGRIAPLRPDQGTTVARVPAQRLEPGRPVSVDVEVRDPRGPYRLGCFVDDHGTGGSGVVLMGTPGGH
ncbi:hypothetical protein Q0Z83_022650 [Actinoplanes sichuanensis]|uniref:Fibronectin type-III domain-containing protein n=1 Tax=Actinoplanes sichuanensis TaxID=512349 RepID=A0ABW4AJG1_9ACTN|nr:hypothetical protein [Actinoplanes sichuanensis]BEL04074.1 hypothetical protein Q0Z83_022650 [Actinoplanes sichuanensis]